MSQIIDLGQVRDKKKKIVDLEQLDIAASYTCLERCLKFIEMNSLKDLRDLKVMMRKTMRTLADKRKK